MPKFHFPLAPVLAQRERIERDHQLRVAAIERERLDAETRLRDLQDQITSSKRDMRARLHGDGAAGGVNVPEVRFQAGASLHLAAQAQRAALELAGVYGRLELARAELLKAATARKAVELLRERRLEEWRRDLARREAAAVDDLATTAHARALMTGTPR